MFDPQRSYLPNQPNNPLDSIQPTRKMETLADRIDRLTLSNILCSRSCSCLRLMAELIDFLVCTSLQRIKQTKSQSRRLKLNFYTQPMTYQLKKMHQQEKRFMFVDLTYIISVSSIVSSWNLHLHHHLRHLLTHVHFPILISSSCFWRLLCTTNYR